MYIFIKKFMALISLLVLVGCGGGGGSSSSRVSNLKYEGKTTIAKLDKQTAREFVSTIRESSLNSVTSNSSSKNKLSKPLQKQNKTIQGNRSGTVDFLTTKVDTLTVKTVATYKNYDDGNNLGIFTGKIIYIITIDKYDNSLINKMDVDITLLSIKDLAKDIILDGTISFTFNNQSGNEILTHNLVTKNNKTKKMYKLENFVIVTDKYGRELSYSGKVYDSNKGYVTITTPVKISYSKKNNIPNMGGVVLYEGKDTIAKERIAYDGRVRIELDRDKDGTVDEIEVYNLENMEVVPNHAPIIEITFPLEIFTNTNLSSVNINSYDPDLDEFSIINYNWKINNILKSNNLSLSNRLFKKHDILKLIVTAEDIRINNKKKSIEIKEQEVLNSKPVVKLKLNKTNIEIGDKILLDASESYDVDGDIFQFHWSTQDRKYNIHDVYNMGKRYLDINESDKSKVLFFGEDINYDMFEKISYYGVNLLLDDTDDNGIIDINSSNIKVTPKDLFNRKLILLENNNLFIDYILAVELADMNNDNLKDMVIIVDRNGDYTGVDKLVVLFQNNLGDFDNSINISLDREDEGHWFNYKSIDIADINNDGLNDISIALGGYHSKFYIYIQNQDGSFSNKKVYKTKTFPAPFSQHADISYEIEYLKSTDINNDGKLDIITIGQNNQAEINMAIDIFIQNDKNLVDEKIIPIYDKNGSSQTGYKHYKIDRIDITDIDKNGMKDIIVDNYILYQENNGSFSEKYFNKMTHLVASDITNNNKTELIAIDTVDHNLTIFKEDNNLNRNYSKVIQKNILIQNPNQIEIKDINQDNKKDIIVGHRAWPYFSIFTQINNAYLGNQLFKINPALASTTLNRSLIVDDINNNGKNEVIIFGRKGFEIFYAK